MIPASIAPGLWAPHGAVILLVCSNVFTAENSNPRRWWPWCWSVGEIAFVEYCFAVPANRIGSAAYSPAELKTIQEVITLGVFAGCTAMYFNEPLSLAQGAGFGLIALGAVLVFRG